MCWPDTYSVFFQHQFYCNYNSSSHWLMTVMTDTFIYFNYQYYILTLFSFSSSLASDILVSIYSLSDCEIRGCVAGLSNPSNNQNMNHMIPIIPVNSGNIMLKTKVYIYMYLYTCNMNHLIPMIHVMYIKLA